MKTDHEQRLTKTVLHTLVTTKLKAQEITCCGTDCVMHNIAQYTRIPGEWGGGVHLTGIFSEWELSTD